LREKLIKFAMPWENSQASVPDQAAQPEMGSVKARILVAEDDPISRELISSRLMEWGYEAVAASDGLQAMAILRDSDGPSLAILDRMMPGMDGLEVCRRLREVEKVVYLILVTARTAKQDVVAGLQAGGDDYLIKPFDKDELHARVLVGLRVIGLQIALAERVKELEAADSQIAELRLSIPL
jgi:DNA-binding response OmpR family regulator